MTASRVQPRPAGPDLRPALVRLASLLAAVTLFAGCAGPVAPDLIITNARVFTNDTARPWAEAIAIKGDRVIAVGAAAAVMTSKAQGTRVLDAGARVVVPGFNDARVDLPLVEPTPELLTDIDRAAIRRGVTSLQVVAGGPMRSLVFVARQAQRQARWRVLRSPQDGEQPQDEETFLPPQPGVRLTANGVAWTTGSAESPRAAVALERLPLIVRWAYGAEDPLVMSGGVDQWREALEGEGVPQVWQRKRPRLDRCAPVLQRELAALARLGVVLMLAPCPVVRTHVPLEASAGSLVAAGLHLAGGSAGSPDPMAVLSMLAGQDLSTGLDAGQGAGRRFTRDEAVRAMTWGSAYAEKAERDKGWLGPGTLADLAVLSGDIFSVPAERLPAITSVLTLVGGTIVHDSGVLTR